MIFLSYSVPVILFPQINKLQSLPKFQISQRASISLFYKDNVTAKKIHYQFCGMRLLKDRSYEAPSFYFYFDVYKELLSMSKQYGNKIFQFFELLTFMGQTKFKFNIKQNIGSNKNNIKNFMGQNHSSIEDTDNEESHIEAQKFGGYLEFGLGSNSIDYLVAQDQDHKIVRLYFKKCSETIQDLIDYYLQEPKNKNEEKGKILCLMDKKSHRLLNSADQISKHYNKKNNQKVAFNLIYIQINKFQKLLEEVDEQQCFIKTEQQQIPRIPKAIKKQNGYLTYVWLPQSQKIIESLVQNYSTIKSFKQSIQNQILIPKREQIFIYDGHQVKDQMYVEDYNYFQKPQTKLTLLQMTRNEKDNFLKRQILKKKIKLKLNQSEFVRFNYAEYSYQECKKIITHFYPNNKSISCLSMGQYIIKPHQQLKQIQKIKSFTEKDEIQCMIIKDSEKLFYFQRMNIRDLDMQDWNIDEDLSKKFNKARKRILKQVKNIDNKIIDPILLYTCNRYFGDLNKSLRNLKFSYDNDFEKQTQFKLCSSLTNALTQLDSFVGQVHRGMKDFRFSSFFSEGECFYWSSFTSTSKKQNIGQNFKKAGGSLIHIQSLTGKQITQFSVYPHEQEVLFLPYTYYLVKKVKRNFDYDEVWLSDLPSPQTYKKNILLWIDDNPQNNSQYFLKIRSKNVQILPITSTKMAQVWMKQFGWVQNWRDIKIRIITDMFRIQQENRENKYAGADLINTLFNNFGYKNPILVYCNDVQKAMISLNQKKVKQDRIYKIANNPSDILKFAMFQ